jgi:hypothetical protein
LKRFAIISFTLIIGAIIISSFFFIGEDVVKVNTKAFIEELIINEYSESLTAAENEEIKRFFQSFNEHQLPHPMIEGVEIHEYDVFTPPTENEEFLQYISVKYDAVEGHVFDTDINFEYILYNLETGNPEEIYFGKIIVRSYDAEFDSKELIYVGPMAKQK